MSTANELTNFVKTDEENEIVKREANEIMYKDISLFPGYKQFLAGDGNMYRAQDSGSGRWRLYRESVKAFVAVATLHSKKWLRRNPSCRELYLAYVDDES